MVTYSARDVAAEIRKRLPLVPIKKLHKLLYYCQGFHLASFDEPLFSETIEAWDRGPVVAALWRDEKYDTPSPTDLMGEQSPPLREAELNTIGYVLSRYGSMTGADLEALTHYEMPWRIANQRRQLTRQQRIDVDEIRAFFRDHRRFEEFDSELDDPDERYEPAEDVIGAWLADAGAHFHDDLAVDDLDNLENVLGS